MLLLRIPTYGMIKAGGITAANFIIDVTLLQSLSGIESIAHGLNPVGWFLSCLFICYMACPAFGQMIRKRCRKFSNIFLFGAVDVAIILALTQLAVQINQRWSSFNTLYYSSPYIRVFYVFLGMLIARGYELGEKRITSKKIIWSLAEIGILIISVVHLWHIDYVHVIWNRLFDLILVMCVVAIFGREQGVISGLLKRKKIVNLGKSRSMYWYLVQFPAIWLIRDIFAYVGWEDFKALQTIMAFVAVIIGGELLRCFSTVFLKIHHKEK